MATVSCSCFFCSAPLHRADERYLITKKVRNAKLGYTRAYQLAFCGVRCLQQFFSCAPRE